MKRIIVLSLIVAMNSIGRVAAKIKQAQDSAFVQSYTRIPPKQMARS